MRQNEKGNREKLMKVLDEILAKYALVFGERAAAEKLKAKNEAFAMSSVGFAGEINGTLSVAASGMLCRVMAAGILGLEPEDKDAVLNKSDALNEFANIACGHFITAALGKSAAVEMKTPVFREITEAEWKETAVKAGGGFIIDGEPITACVTVEKGI